MDKDLLQKFNKVERFHWWWAGRQKLIKDILKTHNPQNVLDIGCGTGQTLSFIKKNFRKAKLSGIDILPEAVTYTRQRGHDATLGDVYHLPYQAKAFDTVLLLDVIEHLKNDDKVIKEARRVLKPDGLLVITAPALPFIWSAHDENQGHFRRYTRRRLRRLSATNKMDLKLLSYFNFFLSPIIITIRLLSRLPIFNTLGQYDSKLNYNLAHKKLLNSILMKTFVSEVSLLKYFSPPIGISVVAVMKKRK